MSLRRAARVRRAVLGLLAGALVLSACSGDEEPVVTAEPAASEEPAEDEAPDEDVDGEDLEPEDLRDRSFLTGEPVDADVLDRPILIVKIENSPQARPQTGLDAADVVFEELVEGGVTRFFALFHSQLPETAGPIRSARPVDTQLMSGYGPSGFAYSGARGEVQAMLAGVPSRTITEGGAGFHRIPDRRAPHNLYLRPAETLQAVVDRGAEPIDDVAWVFDAEPPAGAVSCPSGDADCTDPGAGIRIAMSSSFLTGWEYDEPAGVYRRSQNGQPFLVTGPDAVGAANVVVLETRHYVGDSGYPETDVLTEDARAVVLRDGLRYEARWTKPTPTDPVRVLTVDGEPFPFKPGPTWLHLPSTSAMPPPL